MTRYNWVTDDELLNTAEEYQWNSAPEAHLILELAARLTEALACNEDE